MNAFRRERLKTLLLQVHERNAIWEKGIEVPGYDPNVYRKDVYGSWMQRIAYGDCSNSFGWEIDHIVPVEHGGSEALSNKQPLQWENNRLKGDKMPVSFFGIL